MLQQADPYRATIRKHRKSFIWKGQYFELDSFSEPVKDLMILETKGIAKRESVKFPPSSRCSKTSPAIHIITITTSLISKR